MSVRYTWRLLLEYDGTAYVGWQRQPDGISVQEVLEGALASVLGDERVGAVASGRTDSGVHALGQVVSFRTGVERSELALERGLNALLPPDVAVRRARLAPPGFDACRSARAKLYRYRILDQGERSALRQRFVWYRRGELDVEAMHQAARALVGTHDFTSFRAAGSDAATSVRTIHRLDVTRRDDEVHVEVEGEGFLRHMVRIIVGTLVQVGARRQPPDWVGEVLEARDRALAGRTAQAHGLCLVRVAYDDE